MQVQSIQRFLIEKGYDPKDFDVKSHVDPTLSLQENMKAFVQKLRIPLKKMRGKKRESAGLKMNFTRKERRSIKKIGQQHKRGVY